MLSIRSSVVFLALALVALVGCGSDSDESIPVGTVTKKQFLRRAKVVCSRSLRELNRVDLAAWEKYEPDHTTTDEAVLNKVSLALVPGMERQVRRLRAIGLPKGDERFVYEMLELREEGLQEAREDPSLIRDAGPGTNLYKSYRMSGKYGLEGC
jgi:hypothetical protein